MFTFQELVHMLHYDLYPTKLDTIQQSTDKLSDKEKEIVKDIRDRRSNQEAMAAQRYRRDGGNSSASNKSHEQIKYLMSLKFTNIDTPHAKGPLTNDDLLLAGEIQISTLSF